MAGGKLIGLIGGMSWESSALYYQLLNREVRRRLGGQHNARSILYTLDFAELDDAAAAGNWRLVGDRVADAAQALERAGADMVLITSVTGHIAYEQAQGAVGIPLLHIADAARGRLPPGTRVGLLGTVFTMTGRHLIAPLEDRLELKILTPSEADQQQLQRIISTELQHGEVNAAAQALVRGIVRRLGDQGVSDIILGCTELPLLMPDDHYPLPTHNLVHLHIAHAVAAALGPLTREGRGRQL